MGDLRVEDLLLRGRRACAQQVQPRHERVSVRLDALLLGPAHRVHRLRGERVGAAGRGAELIGGQILRIVQPHDHLEEVRHVPGGGLRALDLAERRG